MKHFVLLFLALGFFSTAAIADSFRKRVIISTDFALGLRGGWRALDDIDDGWAVPMALHDRNLEVVLVSTVLGNSNVKAEQTAAKELIRGVLHSRVPLIRGAAVKLDDPQATLNGTELRGDCWNDGVRGMALALSKGRATILAIGPLTDVGCLALNAPPRIVANIDEIVAIMGRAPNEIFSIGPVSTLTDFNLVMDPRAAEILLNQTEIPMTFLQFDLTKKVLVPSSFVESLANGTRIQRYIHDATAPWLSFWDPTFEEDGFHPWDSNAVFYASDPSAFACSEVNFKLQPCAADGKDTYNRLGGCAGHSAEQGSGLDRESVQLWLGDGVAESRPVRTCNDYRTAAGRARFELAVRAFLEE